VSLLGGTSSLDEALLMLNPLPNNAWIVHSLR